MCFVFCLPGGPRRHRLRPGHPCHPWIAGQKCTRKTGKTGIRFGPELPNVSKDGVTYISYGFCTNVDELQSFRLNYSLASVAPNKTLKTGSS